MEEDKIREGEGKARRTGEGKGREGKGREEKESKWKGKKGKGVLFTSLKKISVLLTFLYWRNITKSGNKGNLSRM